MTPNEQYELDKATAADLDLPAFITFPPERTTHRMSWDGTHVTLEGIEGTWTNPADAYHELRDSIVYIFDESLAPFSGDKLRSPLEDSNRMWVRVHPDLTDGSSYFIGGPTDEDRVMRIKLDYFYFLRQAEKYAAKPDNLSRAYYFIHEHPAFWHLYDRENPTSWETHDGHKAVSVHVKEKKDGSIRVFLNAGGSAEGERASFTYDPDLNVTAKTLDKAYIKLAKRVAKYYGLDGKRSDKRDRRDKLLEALRESNPELFTGGDDE